MTIWKRLLQFRRLNIQIKLISRVLKLLYKSHLSKQYITWRVNPDTNYTFWVTMCHYKMHHHVRKALSVWRHGVFTGTLYVLLSFALPCGWVWLWSSFTLRSRSPSELVAHCSALFGTQPAFVNNVTIGQTKPEPNSQQESQEVGSSPAGRHPSSAQETEQKCFSSCPMAELQAAVMK